MLNPIAADTGQKVRYTLDMSPTDHRGNTETHKHVTNYLE